jgi:hypothetical protein
VNQKQRLTILDGSASYAKKPLVFSKGFTSERKLKEKDLCNLTLTA